MPKQNIDLTPHQRLFAELYVQGVDPVDIMRKLGSTSSEAACSEKARRWLLLPALIQEIANQQALRQVHLAKSFVWEKQDMLKVLQRIATNEQERSKIRIDAISQASRMLGYDSPVKVDLEAGASLLAQIRGAQERREKLAESVTEAIEG
jgi:cell division FtsZ-interacting protein ZapD